MCLLNSWPLLSHCLDMMLHFRASAVLLLAHTAGALVIPTQPVLTRYAASKVLEAAEAKAKDEDWPVTICVCDGGADSA